MTQVSRRLLNKRVEERIFSLFLSSIIACNSKNTAIILLDELFTPTEKVMLAKRFSIAFMLLEGYDYGTIEDTLKVSNSTVCAVSLMLKIKGDGLRLLAKRIKNDEKLKEFWEEMKDGFIEMVTSSNRVQGTVSKEIIRQSKQERIKPF